MVLIDTLYGTLAQTLIDKIAAIGTDLLGIAQVMTTHGHFGHLGGAATLAPLLPAVAFVPGTGTRPNPGLVPPECPSIAGQIDPGDPSCLTPTSVSALPARREGGIPDDAKPYGRRGERFH